MFLLLIEKKKNYESDLAFISEKIFWIGEKITLEIYYFTGISSPLLYYECETHRLIFPGIHPLYPKISQRGVIHEIYAISENGSRSDRN